MTDFQTEVSAFVKTKKGHVKEKGNILVTGGAGYLGSLLVRKLLERGYRVLVWDKLVYGDESIADIRDKIELFTSDIVTSEGPGSLRLVPMYDVDAVVHLAGISTEPTGQYSPHQTNLINHIATMQLAARANEEGVKKFIFASSCSVYFTYDTPLVPPRFKETDKVNPISPYSISKRAAEEALLTIAGENKGFRPVIFRMGTIYGNSPKMRYDLVLNSLVKNAITKRKITVHCNGNIYRPILDINEAADAYIFAIENDLPGDIYNVSTYNVSILNLAVQVAQQLPCEIDIQPVGTARNYMADTTKYDLEMPHITRTLIAAISDIAGHVLNDPDPEKDIYYPDKVWLKK